MRHTLYNNKHICIAHKVVTAIRAHVAYVRLKELREISTPPTLLVEYGTYTPSDYLHPIQHLS